MSAAVELAVRSSALLGAAWAAAAAVQAGRGSAATRHAVWMLGFATIATLPVLTSLLPPLPLPVLPAEFLAPAPAVIQAEGHGSAIQAAATIDYAALVYFFVAAFLIGRLALGRMLLERMWRRAGRGEHCHAELVEIAALLGIRRPLEARIADEPIVPMTWGSIRPRILLPREALAWPAERRSSVLLHELGHIGRHDSLGTLIAQAVCALYWANPLVWIALQQMRLAQEQACDDLVLCNGGAATSYAHTLLDSACALRVPLAATSVAIVRRTDLEKRVRSILGEHSRNRISGVFLGGAAISAVVSGAVVAAVVPVPANVPAEVAPAKLPSARAPRQETTRVATLVKRGGTPPLVHAAHYTRPTPPIFVAAVAVAERSAFDGYQQARARYERESAQYQIDLSEYWQKLADYQLDMAHYQRDLAEHRRQLEAIRLLADGDPRKLAPPAPVAPVAPVVPVVPVVPPVPPDLNHS